MKQIVSWLRQHNVPLKPLIASVVVFFVAILGVGAIAFSHAATPPILSLDPKSGTVTPDSQVSLTVHVNSGSNTIDDVDAKLGYDKTQLQFVSFSESGPFTQVNASDTSTPGIIRISRAVPVGSQAVSGDNSVVTINFKVLATSGSPAISFDEANSLVVRSTDSKNILQTGMTQGATLTVSSDTGGGTSGSNGRLSLDPATLTAKKDDTFAVDLVENSGSVFVSSAQAAIGYDPSMVQYVGVAEGGVFSTQLSFDSSKPGLIRVARGTPVGGSGVSGQNKVVTLTFKMLAGSGSTNLTIDKSGSLLGTSTDSHNILGVVGGTTVTAATTVPAGGSGVFSLQPSSGNYSTGSTITVEIQENGGGAAITTAEPIITYPADKLQFVDVANSTVFPTTQRTKDSAGSLDIIRGVAGHTPPQPVSGTNTVATVHFKVIGSGGTAVLGFADGSGLFDDSGTGKNVLDKSSSKGASYTIATTSENGCSVRPFAPGMPSVTSSSVTSATLSWTASTAGGNCTIAGYHVLRDGRQVGDVTSGTTFKDTGLTSGGTYTYVVQAYDEAGHISDASPALSFTVKADDQAPTVPMGVTAVANASASVKLHWAPSTDLPNPGGSGVKAYNIYRNNDTSPTYTVTGATSFVDSAVTANTSYTYTVTAVDNTGNESAPSNVVNVKTAPPACSGAPSAPSDLSAGTVDISSVSFSWTVSAAPDGCQLAGYKVYRGSNLIATTKDASFTDHDLAPGTTYAYTVRAYDTSAHNSDPSDALTITTVPDSKAPTAPANVKATAISAGQVHVSWDLSTDNVAVTGYRVYRGGKLVRTLSSDTLAYVDTLLKPNTDYAYQVSAVDAAGNESGKAAADPNPVHTPTTPDSHAPTKPDHLKTLVVSTNAVSLSWDASSDDTGVVGYKIFRNGTYVADADTASYTDTDLSEGTSYTYTLRAFDAAGNISEVSQALIVHTLRSSDAGSLVGDANNDGHVNVYDLSIMLKHWQERNVPRGYGDLNGDGVINGLDLKLLIGHYGDKD